MKEVYDMENPYLKNCNSDYLTKEITDWLKLCEKIADGSKQIPNIRFLQGYIDELEMKRALWQDFFSQPVAEIISSMSKAKTRDLVKKEKNNE